ncbi:FxDxF family PEP-CTERM protein [Massilia sp. MB5]|uniref:FxDxF family PEP-CTERM protein n=1 Tax=unclassified Massilia TaxID=2609279 RepID=UPI00067DAC20|nr:MULTISPECIES: FxDxF family PEP-CTERM protein [unclassified Massilia]AKU22884.1 hypothetical protein ACZ75_16805 [Massilia sp. NR 4-1]UMR32289.1 FxDxF family PEP-CTERM protein [Massilia sp. MB5]
MNFKAIAVAAALLASAGAHADNYVVDLTGGPTNWTGGFTATHGAGNFTDTFTFTNFSGKGLAAGFAANYAYKGHDINFTSATLNGITLDLTNTGKESAVRFEDLAVNGPLTLIVSGVSIGSASYSGTLDLVAAPVPEPTTYGMMLGGMGLLAFVARRRKQG